MRAALAALALTAVAGPVWADASACALDRLSLRGDWGEARFSVSVADDAQERAQGLMHVEQMPRMAGMLFVYDSPREVAFWMKNTLIPLDMIFVGEGGRVARVHEMARPLDETPIPGGAQIRYVLELNGGMAAQLGIGPGDELRHPSIEAALWPCETAQAPAEDTEVDAVAQ